MTFNFNRAVELFRSPTALGLASSFAITFTVHTYYTEKAHYKNNSKDQSTLYKTLEFIEQKADDVRFLLRGPITPKERLAVLAIDDQSIYQMGRWPWSRDLTADLVERLMKEGAKTLGFDMVFSEPQIEKTVGLLNEIESEFALPPAVIEKFNQAKNKARPDDQLARVLEKYREKLVMGAFYEDVDATILPYQDLCYNEAFKRTEGYALHEGEASPLFVFNDHYVNSTTGFTFDNYPFEDYFRPIFEKIEAQLTESELRNKFKKRSFADLSPIEKSQIRIDQQRALQGYCAQWLDPEQDKELAYWNKKWPELFADNKFVAELDTYQKINFLEDFMKESPVIQTGLWTVNIPELRKATDHNAMFAAQLDSDGTIRRSPLFYRAGIRQENYIPSLGFQTYLVSSGLQAYITIDKAKEGLFGKPSQRRFAVSKVELKDPETDEVKATVPVDTRGILKINYAGPQMSYPYLSATELFHDRPQITIKQYSFNPLTDAFEIQEKQVDRKEFIKDRIFVVGVTAVAHYDLRTTPFEKNFPGVETHVNVIGNLISKQFLNPMPHEHALMIFSMLLTGLVVSLMLHFLNATWGLTGTALLMVLLALMDKYVFFLQNKTFTTIFLVLETGFIYVLITAFKYFTEERNKRFLKSTFSKYVSPAIVDEILSNPDRIQLGGRKQRLSIFFSDVRGFTSIAEKLDPQVLSDLLNEYLTPMTNLVFQERGTLDKYMGDAIMAFFGAPIFFEDHAKAACQCALDSMTKLRELQVSLQDRGLPLIDIGIGINSAEVSVGNMGSDIVRNYTVMGDGVNLASRLEGINKIYGTNIVISENTYKDVSSEFVCREIDRVRVKGKSQPVRIYELMGRMPPSEEQAGFLKIFGEGYELYHQRQFRSAKDAFEKALVWKENDPVCQLYLTRCEQLLAEPPPETWDGVFELKTK